MWKVSVEPDYYVPDGPKYTITIDGKDVQSTDDTSVGVVSPSTDLSVDNIQLDPGETDTLTFANDATAIAFTAGHPQEPTMTVGASDDAADYEFTLAGMLDNPGETMNLGLPLEGGSLTVNPSGTKGPVTYALTMDRSDEKGTQHFNNDKLTLAPGDSAELQYGNWDSLDQPIPLVTTHNGVQSTQNLMDQP